MILCTHPCKCKEKMDSLKKYSNHADCILFLNLFVATDIVEFDNTYSYFVSKKLYFSIKVVQPTLVLEVDSGHLENEVQSSMSGCTARADDSAII